jgi:hypothetical protein
VLFELLDDRKYTRWIGRQVVRPKFSWIQSGEALKEDNGR